MATHSRKQARGAGKVPISAHPAFPALVALWFAALFGLGSFVLPAALVERAVLATGLDAILPAAAPPLGMTAKLALALGATVLGAVLGWLLGRRVAAAAGAQRAAPATFSQGGQRRPISAKEELGHDGFDAPREGEDAPAPEPARRRRALAVNDESGPSEFLDRAPLPGSDWSAPGYEPLPQSAAEPVTEPSGHGPTMADGDDDALDLALATALEDRFDSPAPVLARRSDDDSAPFVGNAAIDARAEPAEMPAPFARRGEQPPAPEPFSAFAAPAPSSAPNPVPEPEEGPATALPFAPPSLAHLRNDAAADRAPADDGEQPDTASTTPAVPVTDRPLGELGMVELVERLATSLRDAPQPARGLPLADAGSQDFAPAAAPGDAAPARLRAFDTSLLLGMGGDDEEDEDDGDTPGFSLPLNLPHGFSRSVDTPAEAEEDNAADARADVAGTGEEETEDKPAAPTGAPAAFAAPPFASPAVASFAAPFAPPATAIPTATATTSAVTFAMPTPAPATSIAADDGDDGDGEPDDALDEGYSSLLALSGAPARQPEPDPVRIDEPEPDGRDRPVSVVFPGQDQPARPSFSPPSEAVARPFAPPSDPAAARAAAADAPTPAKPDPDTAERELREALERLQRMQGG